MAGELQLLLQSTRSGDLWLLLGLAACFPIARWLFNHTLYSWLSRRWLVPRALHKGKLPDKLASRVTKMNEALWKLTCYSLFVAIASWALLRQDWVHDRDTKKFWEGWPHQEGTSSLRWVCLVEIAYYCSGAVMLVVWEISRQDQNVMMLHHMLAIVIVGCCYMSNYTRACSVALLIHDINDVIMELAKISSYNKLEALANALFVVFILAWIALRMVAYPAVIIRSTLFEITEVLGSSPPYYWVINVPILLLYCIHFYWLWLILKVAYQMVTTGKAEDVREEED